MYGKVGKLIQYYCVYNYEGMKGNLIIMIKNLKGRNYMSKNFS